MTRFFLTALFFFACLGAHADDPVRIVKVPGTFADVKDNVVNAIEGRGLVINSTSHIGEMLRRTGEDIGKATPIYEQAEMFEFCSATASRAMMSADPRHIVFCPYSVSVYTLPGQTGAVFIAYRKPPESPAFAPARALLEGILQEALN